MLREVASVTKTSYSCFVSAASFEDTISSLCKSELVKPFNFVAIDEAMSEYLGRVIGIEG